MPLLKRFLVGLVVAAALLVGGLLLAGQREGAGRCEGAVEITAPAAEVFPWLVEPERLRQWVDGLRTVTPIAGEAGGVGARTRRVVVYRGQRTETETEVVAIDPPHRLTLRVTAGGEMAFTSEVRWELSERDGVTTVTSVSETDFVHRSTRWLEPLIALSSRSKLARDLRHLAELVEAE